MAQLLKKISLRTVFGSKSDIQELVLRDRQAEHLLMRIIGFANGTREAKSREVGDDGEKITSVGLVGEFEATNLQTGEVFSSAVAWLPQMAVDAVAGQLGDEDAQRVGFAFDIGVKYAEQSATSYEFIVKPCVEMKESDAMAELRSKLPDPQSGLPSPDNSQ